MKIAMAQVCHWFVSGSVALFVTTSPAAQGVADQPPDAPARLQALQSVQAGPVRDLVRQSAKGAGPSEPVRAFGLLHHAKGSVILDYLDPDDDNDSIPTLVISNFSGSADDGVAIDVDGFRGWMGDIDFGPAGELAPSQHLQIRSSWDPDFDGDGWPDLRLEISETAGGLAAISIVQPCESCILTVRARRGGMAVAEVTHQDWPAVLATGAFGTVPPAGGEGAGQPVAVGKRMTKADIINPVSASGEIRSAQVLTASIPGIGDAVAIDELRWFIDYGAAAGPRLATASIQPKIRGLEITSPSQQTLRLRAQGVVHRDLAVRAVGQMQIGTGGDCDDDPACVPTLAIDHLGSNDQDVVELRRSARTGRNPQTGKEIKLAAAPVGDKPLKFELPFRIHGGDQGDDGMLSSSVHSLGDAIQLGADFSAGGSAASKVCARDNGTLWCWGDNTSAMVTAPPGGAPPVLEAMAQSPHAGGDHVPGFAWRFQDPVMIRVADNEVVAGREVLFLAGQPIILDNEAGVLLSLMPGEASPVALELLDAGPSGFRLEASHVFGLWAEAEAGTSMWFDDFDTIDNAPEEKERGLTMSGGIGGSGGRVAVYGFSPDATSSCDSCGIEAVSVRFKAGADLAGQVNMMASNVHGDALCGFERTACLAGSCPGSDGIDDAVEVIFRCPGLGEPLAYEVEVFLNGESVHLSESEEAPRVYLGGGSTTDAILMVGRSEGKTVGPIRWMAPESIRVGAHSPMVQGDTVLISVDAPAPIGAIHSLSLEGVDPPEVEGTLMHIADISIGQFGIEHLAADAGRLSCCDGDGFYDVLLENPGQDQPATLVSRLPRAVHDSARNAIQNIRLFLSDPCAGDPEACASLADTAELISAAGFQDPDAGDSDQSRVRWTSLSMQKFPQQSSYRTIVAPNFSALDAEGVLLEILDGESVVHSTPDFSGQIVISCPSCTDDAWPTSIAWQLDDGDTPRVDLREGGPRLFEIFGVHAPERGGGLTGDGLRLSLPGVSDAVWSIESVRTTTVNVPLLQLDNLEFEPVSLPCLDPEDPSEHCVAQRRIFQDRFELKGPGG